MFFAGIGFYIVLILMQIFSIPIKFLICGLYEKCFRPVICDNYMGTYDDDVIAEQERINQMSIQELKSQMLAMQKVSKTYKKLCAVKQFSIGLKR